MFKNRKQAALLLAGALKKYTSDDVIVVGIPKYKTVIIVDDGIATGATVFATIKMCRKRGAAKIVVASPVCAITTADELRLEADEVVVLEMPERFFSVSQYYESFHDLTYNEAVEFLEKWKKDLA